MTDIVTKIDNWLIQIGIMPNLAGFTYIKESVELCTDHVELLGYLTTQLYKIIAYKHGKSVSVIERNIRHAIQVASNSNKIIRLNNVVGQTVLGSLDKPSAGLLISLLAQKCKSLSM